jgi:hypothetical protein
VRVGLIARADNRGLGNLTRDFYSHVQPAKVLVVLMKPNDFTPYDEHAEWYPGARTAVYDNGLPTEALEWLLEGISVLYTAETPYDHRLFEMARQRGVRTALHGMHEFMRWRTEKDLPRPDLFLAPSTWHYDEWPEPKALLRVPVARDVFSPTARTSARSFVHVAGHHASGDRNGTRAVIAAVPFVRHPDVTMIIRTQGRLGWVPRGRSGARVEVVEGDVGSSADLYADADALLAPRRYGGLSLPMQEAASLRMPVVATMMKPQVEWLPRRGLVRVARYQQMRLPAATVARAHIDPRRLAAKIDQLANDDELVASLSAESDAAAEEISWGRMLPRYLEVLERLCT